MRFYDGAHEAIMDASKKPLLEQRLYLVAEVDSKHDINAVMLHNGTQKLGSVTSTEAPAIKQLLEKLRTEDGPKGDVVIVCSVDRITESLTNFKYVATLRIHGHYIVNERLARKFALKVERI